MSLFVQMTREEVDHFYCATDETHLILGQVKDTFDLIATLLEDGDHARHDGIAAVSRLAGRALMDLYDRYPDSLHDLSQRLSQTLKKGEAE